MADTPNNNAPQAPAQEEDLFEVRTRTAQLPGGPNYVAPVVAPPPPSQPDPQASLTCLPP